MCFLKPLPEIRLQLDQFTLYLDYLIDDTIKRGLFVRFQYNSTSVSDFLHTLYSLLQQQHKLFWFNKVFIFSSILIVKKKFYLPKKAFFFGSFALDLIQTAEEQAEINVVTHDGASDRNLSHISIACPIPDVPKHLYAGGITTCFVRLKYLWNGTNPSFNGLKSVLSTPLVCHKLEWQRQLFWGFMNISPVCYWWIGRTHVHY